MHSLLLPRFINDVGVCVYQNVVPYYMYFCFLEQSLALGYTTDDDFAGFDSFDDQEDYLASVDIRELEEIASIGSESVGNIDWDAVDKMIEDVQF